MLDKEVFEYDETRMLVYSVDMPVASRVVRASPDEPYLSFRLDIDPLRVAELLPKVHPQGVPRMADGRAIIRRQTGEFVDGNCRRNRQTPSVRIM